MESHQLLLTMVVYKITVINSRELIRTDYSYLGFRSWDDMYFWHILSSKYAAGCACSVLFIKDILKCVFRGPQQAWSLGGYHGNLKSWNIKVILIAYINIWKLPSHVLRALPSCVWNLNEILKSYWNLWNPGGDLALLLTPQVKHIATDLCFKTSHTLFMDCAQKQHN